MTGLSAYYSETSPSGLVVLPVAWDPTSNPYPVIREQILLETGMGVTFEYELFSRLSPNFIYTVPASLLGAYREMHDAVVGSGFYFVPDMNVSPLTTLHVRKQPNFEPESIGVYLFEGVAQQFFRYELKLRAEITAAEIED